MEAVEMGNEKMRGIQCQIFGPEEAKKIEPRLEGQAWVYHYTNTETGWILSIATHGEPGSGKLSLGGFRIAPEDRVSAGGYSNDREALDLAIGMEKKAFWSRLIQVAGPLGIDHLNRVVGGKCVLLPTVNARVGKPKDMQLLDFAVSCLKDFELESGVNIITGQDLGHGVLSDGKTSSLTYLHENFHGSVLEDTSIPTGEGNFYAIMGALKALEIDPADARITLIGCGHIGSHVLERLQQVGCSVKVIEASESKVKKLTQDGVQAFAPDQKLEILAQETDVLALNANGGTLDQETVDLLCEKKSARVITGCENLVMTDPAFEQTLREAGIVFCPTEFCGMMGYLTAVEEYLSYRAGAGYDVQSVIDAAARIEEPAQKAVAEVIKTDFQKSFTQVLCGLYQ